MKRKEILNRLAAFFDLAGRKQQKRRDELRRLLRKLKEKEKKLKDRIEEGDPAREKGLRKELKVVRAQRRKGIKILKELD